MFDSHVYSNEELVACGVARIENATLENSAAYIGAWLERPRSDKRPIVQAAARAQKAVDLILGAAQTAGQGGATLAAEGSAR